MSRSRVSDLFGILKGAQSVTNAIIKYQENAIRFAIIHSSLKNLPEKCLQIGQKKLSDIEPSKVPVSLMFKVIYIIMLHIGSYNDIPVTGTSSKRSKRCNGTYVHG